MATHSSVLAWRIPGMVEPGGLPSLGSHRVGHDWHDLAAAAAAAAGQNAHVMAESEAAKPDPRGESGNGVCSQQSNTRKTAQGPDITEQHTSPRHTPGLSHKKHI